MNKDEIEKWVINFIYHFLFYKIPSENGYQIS